eukprot:3630957-Ditylum_brightwellii.AAC.1
MSITACMRMHMFLDTSDDDKSRPSEEDEKVEDSKFHLPTVTEIRPDVRTKEMKGAMKGWEQHGPVVYGELPTVGSIVDKYLPDSFILEMVNHSEDHAIKRKSLQPDL